MLYCYLERLAVLFGALAERGSLPSAVSSAAASKASESAILVITRAWIPQKRVIIAFSFGFQAAKLERVSHSPLHQECLHDLVIISVQSQLSIRAAGTSERK